MGHWFHYRRGLNQVYRSALSFFDFNRPVNGDRLFRVLLSVLLDSIYCYINRYQVFSGLRNRA